MKTFRYVMNASLSTLDPRSDVSSLSPDAAQRYDFAEAERDGDREPILPANGGGEG